MSISILISAHRQIKFRVQHYDLESLRCSLIYQHFITIGTFTCKRHQSAISFSLSAYSLPSIFYSFRLQIYEIIGINAKKVVVFCFLFFLPILQNVARLTIQGTADGLEGGETDGFGLARFQDGKVGLGDANLLGKVLR